jgi:uncharacterized protein YigE (DUF2233 family)
MKQNPLRAAVVGGLLLLVGLTGAASGQGWHQLYDDPHHNQDLAYAIAVDGAGNVYVTGESFYDKTRKLDYCTIKYDAEGHRQWIRWYNGPSQGRRYPRYYVGNYWYRDAAQAIAANGTEEWVRRCPPPKKEGAAGGVAIALDDTGNLYILGELRIDNKGKMLQAVCLIKYDANGNQKWIRYDYTHAEARTLAIDNNGNIHTAATIATESWDTYNWMGPAWLSVSGRASSSDNGIYIAVYDSNGNRLANRRFGMGLKGSHANIALDGAGNVYARRLADRYKRGAATELVKYDATGKRLWVIPQSTTEMSLDEALGVDRAGNVYVTQSVFSLARCQLVKYNPDGQPLWTQTHTYDNVATSGIETIAFVALVVDGAGNVYTVGVEDAGSGYGTGNYLVDKFPASGERTKSAVSDTPTRTPPSPPKDTQTGKSGIEATPVEGEIRLDGTIRSVNAAQNSFVLDATSFTNPNGNSRPLSPPKPKTVIVTAQTQIHVSGKAEREASLADLKAGMFAIIIGKDLGSGRNLPAREVAVKGSAELPPASSANQPPAIANQQVVRGGAVSPAASRGQPDAMWTQKAAGVPVRVIRINLADPRVRVTPLVSSGFPHSAESFSSMIARARSTIAINGAYFSKDNLRPIGDIVIGGRLVNRGGMGTALAITRDNRAVIRRVQWGHGEDWSDFESVLACGPALVLNGVVDVQPEIEGFKDPHVMGATQRMGVGLTADRHLLIVTTLSGVTFQQWGQVMRALGCTDAMNLDAGASLAMYYRGKTLIPAGRHLMNLLLVYVHTER